MVATWKCGLLRPGPRVRQGRIRSEVGVLDWKVRSWKPGKLLSGRPSSTSAHSAGREIKGGVALLAAQLLFKRIPLVQAS